MKKTIFLLICILLSTLLSADVVILKNRRQINAQNYRIAGDLVYIVLEDGVVYSIKKESVDLELTQRVNAELRQRKAAGSQITDDDVRTIVQVSEELKIKQQQVEQKEKSEEKVTERFPVVTEKQVEGREGRSGSGPMEVPAVAYPEGEGPDKPISLYPTVDLYIDEYRNRGIDEQDLRVCGTLKHTRLALMKFDYAYLKNVTIKEARLRFYVFEPLQSPGRLFVRATIPDKSWSLSSIDNYRDAPGPAANVEGSGDSVTEKKGWYDINVTDLLKHEIETEKTYGFIIYTKQNGSFRMCSREAKESDKKPYLAINSRKEAPKYSTVTTTSMQEPITPKTLLARFIEKPGFLFAFIVSFIPALAIFFVTSRWLNKKFSFLLALGVLLAAFISVVLSLKISF